MAVKLSIFTVILISFVWLVHLMPVAFVLQESKTVIDIVRDEYNDEAFSPRFKKSVVVVGTCPKGMKFYNNQCLTSEELQRQEDEDYDDDVSTARTTKDITKDRSTQEDLPESVTSATYTKISVNVNDWSSTETKYNDSTVRHTTDPSSDDNVNQLELKDETTVTANYSSSTERRNYDAKEEAGVTVTSSDDADKNTLKKRKFYKLMATAFAICCWIGLLLWLPKCLCQRDLRRNDVENSHSLLALSSSSSETISDASLMDHMQMLQST